MDGVFYLGHTNPASKTVKTLKVRPARFTAATEKNITSQLGSIVAVAFFVVVGVRLIVTHKHSKDLGYIDSFFRPTAGPVKESPPWIPLTIGIVFLAFGILMLLLPTGVGLARFIRL